jgi:hypothetical protein
MTNAVELFLQYAQGEGPIVVDEAEYRDILSLLERDHRLGWDNDLQEWVDVPWFWYVDDEGNKLLFGRPLMKRASP